jgi:siroheme synthase-like protein
VFVFGGGSLSLAKVQILCGVGARVTVIADRFVKGFEGLPAELRTQAFPQTLDFLSGAFFVVAATNNRDLDARISKECRRLKVLCNSVDDLASGVHFPSMVSRGPLRIAVSSGGASPGLSRMARQEIERAIGPEWGGMADLQAVARMELKRICHSKEKRKQVIGQILKDQELWDLLRERRQEEALSIMRNRYLGGLA